MKKVIFVCHGNICRSVAAECIMKSMTDKFKVISRATSYEEIGNDIYTPMKRELIKNGIPFARHYAKRIDYKDYEWADYIFHMDEENRYSLEECFLILIRFFLYSNLLMAYMKLKIRGIPINSMLL